MKDYFYTITDDRNVSYEGFNILHMSLSRHVFWHLMFGQLD